MKILRNQNIISLHFGRTRVFTKTSLQDHILLYKRNYKDIFMPNHYTYTLTYQCNALMGLIDMLDENNRQNGNLLYENDKIWIYQLIQKNIQYIQDNIFKDMNVENVQPLRIEYPEMLENTVRNKRTMPHTLPWTVEKYGMYAEPITLRSNYLSSLDYATLLIVLIMIDKHLCIENLIPCEAIDAVKDGMDNYTKKYIDGYDWYVEYEGYAPVLNGHLYSLLALYMYGEWDGGKHTELENHIENLITNFHRFTFTEEEAKDNPLKWLTSYDLDRKHIAPNYDLGFQHNYHNIHIQQMNQLLRITGDERIADIVNTMQKNWALYRVWQDARDINYM